MQETVTLSGGARLTPFLCAGDAQLGVLVLPGGGYHNLAIDHEGQQIAAWLNQHGYDAWMLEYTVISQGHESPLHPRPINDARAALQYVREQNRVAKLGVWGFSAGGHLAATLSTETDSAPDFSILAYPVISSLSGWAHNGSRDALIGAEPPQELTALLAMENRINPTTPPTFIFHTANDPAVDVRGVLGYSAKLSENGVPFELHVYENGAHGVGLAPDDSILSSWSQRLEQWLEQR